MPINLPLDRKLHIGQVGGSFIERIHALVASETAELTRTLAERNFLSFRIFQGAHSTTFPPEYLAHSLSGTLRRGVLIDLASSILVKSTYRDRRSSYRRGLLG